MINVPPDKYLKQGLRLSNQIFVFAGVFIGFTIASLFASAEVVRLLALVASLSACASLLSLSYYVQMLTHDRLEIMELKKLDMSRRPPE